MSTASGITLAGENHCPEIFATRISPAAVGRFDQRAADYKRHAAIQRDMAAWLAQWLPQRKAANTHTPTLDTGNMRVLDLGAGEGTFTHHLTQRFGEVSALDRSPQMLCEGRRNLPQVNWLHGDAWTLQPLGDDLLRHMDCITSASLLQWCPAPQATLRYWAERCRTGTRMLHGFYVKPTLQQWLTVFGQNGQLDWLEAKTWHAIFAAAGWRVLRSECVERHYRFDNALALARSLHGTGAIANAGQLGSGRYRALLRQYDVRYRITNLPATTPLYHFGDAPLKGCANPPKHRRNAASNPSHSDSPTEQTDSALTEQTDSTLTKQLPSATNGVYASWAFFRIETELGQAP